MRNGIHNAGFGMMLVFLLCSCSPDKEDPAQPYSPASNEAISGQTIFGDERSFSIIRRWTVHGDGSIFFFGSVNSLWCLNRIDVDGNILWQRGQPFYVTGLSTFESSAWDGGFAIVAASNSYEPNLDEPAYGIIDVYDRNGTVVIHKLVTDPEYDIRIEGLRPLTSQPAVGSPTFFITGAARKDAMTYPYCGLFRIMSDSTMLLVKQKIFVEVLNRHFIGAAWNANSASPAYFASSSATSSECPDWQSSAEGTCWSDSVVCFDDTLGVTWSCGIAPQNALRSQIRSLEYYEGSIYATGCVMVLKSDGLEWMAGLIASIAESGSLNWSKSIILSETSDSYLAAVIYRGSLHAVGVFSRLVRNSTNRHYGFALVSVFALPAGDARSHSTFGNTSYWSGFTAAAIAGSSLMCGGFTSYYIENYGYRGWFANIEPSMLATGFVATPPFEKMSREDIRPPLLLDP